jgi:hypothetical protein
MQIGLPVYRHLKTESVLAGVSIGQGRVSIKSIKSWRATQGIEDIRDVEEAIFVLVLFVDAAHQRGSRRKNFVDEYEDGLFGRQLDALADHVDELADGKVCGDEIFLLVDSRYIRLFDFLADDLLKAVSITIVGATTCRR